MATEQALYAQVVMLLQKYLKIAEGNKNKNEDKFKIWGQSVRLESFLDLDFDCTEENFSTCEPEFYNKIFQIHYEIQYQNIFKMFLVLIGNNKNVEEMKFHIDDPILKYCQSTSNSCCFSILASAFDTINQIKAASDISKRIE